MAATTTPATTTMTDLRTQHHSRCIVCSPDIADGLRLQLVLDDQGAAVGDFACDARYGGYPGMMHGGIIAALLDGAMTNCLFLHGITAVTAQLVVHFRHPVLLNTTAQVRAWITQQDSPVFRLQAQLRQQQVVKATANAAFMLPRDVPGPAMEAHL